MLSIFEPEKNNRIRIFEPVPKKRLAYKSFVTDIIQIDKVRARHFHSCKRFIDDAIKSMMEGNLSSCSV